MIITEDIMTCIIMTEDMIEGTIEGTIEDMTETDIINTHTVTDMADAIIRFGGYSGLSSSYKNQGRNASL